MEPTQTVPLSVAARGRLRLTAQAALVVQKTMLAATALAKALAAAVAVVTTAPLAARESQAQAAARGSNRLAASRQLMARPSRLLLAQGEMAQATHRETAATALVAASALAGTVRLQSTQALQRGW